MKTLTFELPDEVWKVVEEMAIKEGRPAEAIALEVLRKYRYKKRPQLTEEERKAADQQLFRHAGRVSSGHPLGSDNDSIDADLAREYGSTHEKED